MYTVILHGCNPDWDNDNVIASLDFETFEQAEVAYNDPKSAFPEPLIEGQYVELDGPDHNEERKLEDGEWAVSERESKLSDMYERFVQGYECP